jgi:uncharacterized protein with NRDE domain
VCLLVLAWQILPDVPLVLAGNRDEFHQRPAAACHWWREPPGILGGRDLEAGGGWLAVNRAGRLAVVTNVREPGAKVTGQRSRGELVVDVLSFDGPVRDWIAGLDERRAEFAGFNLMIRDGEDLHSLTNRGEDRLDLEPGIYGLSNRGLNTPWPKVEVVRDGLRSLVDDGDVQSDSLFGLLTDRSPAPDEKLPDTGVPLEWERALSAVFIAGSDYGTRASTVVLAGADGKVELEERRFGPDGEPTGSSRFEFDVVWDR